MLACPIPAECLLCSSSSFRVEALHWPLLQCCFSNTVYNLSPSLWRNAKNVCSASPGVATRAGKRVLMVDLIVLTCETQRLKQRLSSVTERLLPDKRCWSQITDVFCLLLTSWYITQLLSEHYFPVGVSAYTRMLSSCYRWKWSFFCLKPSWGIWRQRLCFCLIVFDKNVFALAQSRKLTGLSW